MMQQSRPVRPPQQRAPEQQRRSLEEVDGERCADAQREKSRDVRAWQLHLCFCWN